MITAIIVSLVCLIIVTASLGVMLLIEHSVSSSLSMRLIEQERQSKMIEEDLCKDIKHRAEQLNALSKELNALKARNKPESVTVTVVVGTEKYPPGTVFKSKSAARAALDIKSHSWLDGRNKVTVCNGYTLKIG